VAPHVRRNFVEKEGFFSRRVRHIHTHPTSFPASATLSAFRPTTTAREGVRTFRQKRKSLSADKMVVASTSSYAFLFASFTPSKRCYLAFGFLNNLPTICAA